jgi:dTDP-4-amino-4,6-dideoxygalactose transaminase
MINSGLPAIHGRIREVGINAKMSELHAAMGLCVLDDIGGIIERRLERVALYRALLDGHVETLPEPRDVRRNGAYMPILLDSRTLRDIVMEALAENGYESRRYFHPSLDRGYGLTERGAPVPVSWSASERVLCLPLFDGLPLDDVRKVCSLVVATLGALTRPVSSPTRRDRTARRAPQS